MTGRQKTGRKSNFLKKSSFFESTGTNAFSRIQNIPFLRMGSTQKPSVLRVTRILQVHKLDLGSWASSAKEKPCLRLRATRTGILVCPENRAVIQVANSNDVRRRQGKVAISKAPDVLHNRTWRHKRGGCDDVCYNIYERLKLEGETERLAFVRGSGKA